MAVEINSTFYREHRRSTFMKWRSATPKAFRFAVKMPRAITHESGLAGTGRLQDAFFESVNALGDKLEVILIQLPPSLAFDPRQSRRFFRCAHALCDAAIVCEPRHSSWFTERADQCLVDERIHRAAVDPTSEPHGAKPGGDLNLAYFRWHGSPRRFYSSYTGERLRDFSRAIEVSSSKNVWAVFDNTASGAAWPNAVEFAKMATWR